MQDLGFKFFSPSKEEVSMKQAPPSKELEIKIKSAGMTSLLSQKIIFPTIISD